MDTKKYMGAISVLLGVLLATGIAINIFINSLTHIFSILINIVVVAIAITIIFSIVTTNNIIKGREVSSLIMKVNFKITSILYPAIVVVADLFKIPKDEIRKVYVNLNNKYIYTNKYNIKPEDILVLIPHCIQKNSCKLKVTTDIKTCARCGKCKIGELVELKEKKNINIFVATGGTLARKIIKDNKPKAVIAVACERDLTSGVQEVKRIPVLGVFNKRPNGPCVNTTIDIDEIEKAIYFLQGNEIVK